MEGQWFEEELAGCRLGDGRLDRRLRQLVEQMEAGFGESIPLACQDWANTKAAYRFFSNDRVSEEDILRGHFDATRRRFAASAGPILVLHDTTEFSWRRKRGDVRKPERERFGTGSRHRVGSECPDVRPGVAFGREGAAGDGRRHPDDGAGRAVRHCCAQGHSAGRHSAEARPVLEAERGEGLGGPEPLCDPEGKIAAGGSRVRAPVNGEETRAVSGLPLLSRTATRCSPWTFTSAMASDTLWEPTAGEPVDTAPDEEMGVQFPGEAEQLPDVALAIGDVNAARRLTEQFCGLAQIGQPAHALLALDRHARRIDLPLERRRALELLAVPELDRSDSQRKPSVATARLECIGRPQTVYTRSRPNLSLPLLTFVVKPFASGRLCCQENSVVS